MAPILEAVAEAEWNKYGIGSKYISVNGKYPILGLYTLCGMMNIIYIV